jgi:hypothetical protein
MQRGWSTKVVEYESRCHSAGSQNQKLILGVTVCQCILHPLRLAATAGPGLLRIFGVTIFRRQNRFGFLAWKSGQFGEGIPHFPRGSFGRCKCFFALLVLIAVNGLIDVLLELFEIFQLLISGPN